MFDKVASLINRWPLHGNGGRANIGPGVQGAVKLLAWQDRIARSLFGRPLGLPTVSAIRGEWSFDREDGEKFVGDGYNFHAANGGEIRYADIADVLPGALIFRVAGVSHRPGALQASCFAPGLDVVLVPEPGNSWDKNAVAVWDVGRKVHLGYVPRELAESVCRDLAKGAKGRGVCVWQWHNTDGARVGIKVLFGPGLDGLEFR